MKKTSSSPVHSTNANVQNKFGQLCLNQTYPKRPGTHQQRSQTPQGVPANVKTGPHGPPSKGSIPIKHVTGPMTPNQSGTSKCPSPSGKGDFFNNTQVLNTNIGISKKRRKLADKILPQNVGGIIESQAYTDLTAFEKNLDLAIIKKRLDIQEALKCPVRQKRKLRLSVSNTFYPAKEPSENKEGSVASWELRVDGFLLDDPKKEPNKIKRKFSSFFKSLVIEFDKDLYGPDNHLVKWNRTATTKETDGFQVKRPGSKDVRCTILLSLDYQPLQFKLDDRLARLLGVHTQTRPFIIKALWQFIKTHKLQDSHEKEYINCDKYLKQIFDCSRMKFVEIPQRLNNLLHPPDPIVIYYLISVGAVEEHRKTVCYDIEVEVDDALKAQMNTFLLTTASQQELQSLDDKIHETIETINQLKINREFFLSFASSPQQFMYEWTISQTRDSKIITDVVGNPEEERRAEFYNQPWAQEAVKRYIYFKAQQKQAELVPQLSKSNS